MKASIRIREDRKPILRAKLPLNILGFPFRSGIEAGDSKELCLSFSTWFESGPLLKLCYRPNDSWRPFGFIVKTGIGHFGSPIRAPMTMSAEFNFVGNGSPSFFLHFRPQVGDFSIKRSVNSNVGLCSQNSETSNSVSKTIPHGNEVDSATDEFLENNETPVKIGGNRTWTGLFSGEGINGLPADKVVERLFSRTDICARTSLPLRDRAVVKLRWSVRFPANDRAEISFQKIPDLVLSEIGIEHVVVNKNEPERSLRCNGGNVPEACLGLKRELDVLQVESGLLRDDIEELRSKIVAGKSIPVADGKVSRRIGEIERNGGKPLGGTKQNKESNADKGTDGNDKSFAAKPS